MNKNILLRAMKAMVALMLAAAVSVICGTTSASAATQNLFWYADQNHALNLGNNQRLEIQLYDNNNNPIIPVGLGSQYWAQYTDEYGTTVQLKLEVDHQTAYTYDYRLYTCWFTNGVCGDTHDATHDIATATGWWQDPSKHWFGAVFANSGWDGNFHAGHLYGVNYSKQADGTIGNVAIVGDWNGNCDYYNQCRDGSATTLTLDRNLRDGHDELETNPSGASYHLDKLVIV